MAQVGEIVHRGVFIIDSRAADTTQGAGATVAMILTNLSSYIQHLKGYLFGSCLSMG